jgi:hypothetical protein
MSDRQSTEDLIRDLAARPAPAAFDPAATLGFALGAGMIGLALYFAVFGLRPDLGGAWEQVPVQAKSLLPLVLSVLAFRLVLRSARPGTQAPLWPLALPVAAAFALLAFRISVADGPWMTEAAGQTALACLLSIITLSFPPLAAGISLLRNSAPTRPVLTGALLGIATGAGVAAGYALHCTEDSPLFFVTWYGLGIGLATCLGGWLGHRFLRW